jgi:cellulose synthase/poly-beta-1,6-N-acetylglucosamine synthase-like glycosyltransferase
MFLVETAEFIQRHTAFELISIFWYFFLFEFTRNVIFSLVFIAVFMRRWRHERRERAIARKKVFTVRPLVSIVAPGKNEGRNIHKLAESITKQTYSNYELIFVDDGSDDDSVAIGRELLAKGKIDQFFSNVQRGGKASAANLALRYARGEYILHLDADSHLKDDAIENILIRFFMDSQIGAVGGDIRVSNMSDSICSTLQGIEYLKSISASRTASTELGILRIISGAFGTFRTDILRRLGGWDPGPGLDGDITLKFRKIGFKVVHEPMSICYTNAPTSFKALAKQRFRWDRSIVRFRLRKHRDLFDITNKNFNIYNFMAAADNVLYSIIFNVNWVFFLLQLFLYDQTYSVHILVINYFLYTVSNILKYGAACILHHRTLRAIEITAFLYLPLMPIYVGIFMRLVRLYAQSMEFFHKVSYLDAWNPWKVSYHARKNGL